MATSSQTRYLKNLVGACKREESNSPTSDWKRLTILT